MSNRITVVAGGDVEWSGIKFDYEQWSQEVLFFDPGEKSSPDEKGWVAVPRMISPETKALLARSDPQAFARYHDLLGGQEKALAKIREHFSKKALHGMTFSSRSEWAQHPFLRIASAFREADIAFLNLETPLSDTAYRVGAFLTPTAFTEGLAFAGIDVVSIANNHMLDAEVCGLLDTVAALDTSGIAHIGAGKSLSEARRPYVTERNGIKIAFLAYSQEENSNGFATRLRPGVAPMDPLLIEQDIERVRGSVDHVVLSLHWGSYDYDDPKRFEVHPSAIAFGHHLIDAGADAILGHHPHLPHAVEFYRGKPILYSMAHLIFSGAHPSWVDNYVARLTLAKDRVLSAEILPVAGRMRELSQPHFLEGARAREMLTHLQSISSDMSGMLKIEGNKGVLTDG